jgi:hypothetical protein
VKCELMMERFLKQNDQNSAEMMARSGHDHVHMDESISIFLGEDKASKYLRSRIIEAVHASLPRYQRTGHVTTYA